MYSVIMYSLFRLKDIFTWNFYAQADIIFTNCDTARMIERGLRA